MIAIAVIVVIMFELLATKVKTIPFMAWPTEKHTKLPLIVSI